MVDREVPSRGQMASLNNCSFCCLVTRVASTFSRRDVSFSTNSSLACISAWTGAPRRLKVLSPMYRMVSSLILSLGSYGLPLDAWIASDTHFGTLAFMPDHVSQASVVARSVWQEDGPSAMREVLSAYCSRLDLSEEIPREYLNSAWDLLMVSNRVFITVLNTSTDRWSPWYTPICRWKGSVCQDSVEMIPVRSWYKLEVMSIIS